MVKHRSSSRSITSARFFSIKAISLYLIFVFAFTIWVLVFSSRNIQTDDQTQHQDPLDSDGIPPPYIPPRKNLRTSSEDTQLWTHPFSFGLHPCVKPTPKYKEFSESDHYITVRSNGGLNQMRTGIADIVAVAHIMNATLVIPELDKRSFWQDSSVFSDIFDEMHFMKALRRDVKIIKKLPKEVESLPRARKHFTSWSGVGYYEDMTHLWKEYKVIHVAKSDSRLANNDLPIDIQRLRCRVLYRGLRFSPAIESLGQT